MSDFPAAAGGDGLMTPQEIVAALRRAAHLTLNIDGHSHYALDGDSRALLRRLAERMEGARVGYEAENFIDLLDVDHSEGQRVLVIPWPDDDQQAGGKT